MYMKGYPKALNIMAWTQSIRMLDGNVVDSICHFRVLEVICVKRGCPSSQGPNTEKHSGESTCCYPFKVFRNPDAAQKVKILT